MRYVESRISLWDREETYRVYVTDALRAFGKLNARYYDFVKDTPVETRTGKEVINSIKEKLKKLRGS